MRHELVNHVRVRDDGREAQLRSNVHGTRSGREDVVVVDEWVPLGLASQGLEQANQRIAEGAEALDDRRDELAAYALRKRVVLVLLVLLLGGSGDAGGGRAAGGAGRRAAGVRNGDVEEEMASDATVTIMTRSARRQPGLFPRLRGGRTSLNRLPAPRV